MDVTAEVHQERWYLLTPAERTRASGMHEDRGPDSLERNLRDLLGELGLTGFHNPQAIGCSSGWVDWVIQGKGGTIFRELKTMYGQLTPAQRLVGARLERHGHDWAVWRPIDLINGTISYQLEKLR